MSARRPWTILLDGSGDNARRSLESAVAEAGSGEPPNVGVADDTCVIIYTSGTTGVPKGVMHSQRT